MRWSRVLPRVTGDLEPVSDWSVTLDSLSAVVRCAARLHVIADTAVNPLDEFRRINVQRALNLARQAVAAGIESFVFVSSIKVNGEATQLDRTFMVDDAPESINAYDVFKMAAEQGLREITAQIHMDVVIFRLPLVYGSGVKGNFASMMRGPKFGVPLSLGPINNQRSLVSLGTLVDLILTCLIHPAATNQTFMVSNAEDVFTTDLSRPMGQAMGCSARLVPVPENLLRVATDLIGRTDMAQRLCGSLQVDISKTGELLGWTAPLTLDAGLAQAVFGFK